MVTGEKANYPLKLLAFALLATAILAVSLKPLVSADALAPAVVTILFLGAGGLAAITCLQRQMSRTMSRKTIPTRIELMEIAGAMTFIGAAVSLSFDAEVMMRLLVFSDQPE